MIVVQQLEDNELNSQKNAGTDQRRWERFSLNRPGTLMTIKRGLHGTSSRTCQVLDVSVGGANVEVITTIGLPDHYYLCFIGMEERLGVAEVHRTGTRIGLRFIKLLDEQLLNRILRGE